MRRRNSMIASIAQLLTACDSHRPQFAGTWTCQSDNGLIDGLSLRISKAGADVYTVEWPMVGDVDFTYDNGKLVGPRHVVLTIDDDTGKLIGMPGCAMTKAD